MLMFKLVSCTNPKVSFFGPIDPEIKDIELQLIPSWYSAYMELLHLPFQPKVVGTLETSGKDVFTKAVIDILVKKELLNYKSLIDTRFDLSLIIPLLEKLKLHIGKQPLHQDYATAEQLLSAIFSRTLDFPISKEHFVFVLSILKEINDFQYLNEMIRQYPRGRSNPSQEIEKLLDAIKKDSNLSGLLVKFANLDMPNVGRTLCQIPSLKTFFE